MGYTVIMHSGELYHHGVMGQKWGQRNGPPYPLDASDHSASERKAGWRESLKSNASKLGASNLKRMQTKQRAARDRKKRDADIQRQYDKEINRIESKYTKGQKLSKEDVLREKEAGERAKQAWADSKKQLKSDKKEAQRVNNKETWDVLASGSRQRRLDKLNKVAEKKLNKNEKQRERIMNARQKSRDFYENRYDKKIAKGKMDEDTKKAKLKDFDLGTKAVNQAYDRYWNTYSNRANEKAKTILDPSNKKSEAYQKAAKEYTKQWMNEYVWYGKDGTITNYASDAARSMPEYSERNKKK